MTHTLPFLANEYVGSYIFLVFARSYFKKKVLFTLKLDIAVELGRAVKLGLSEIRLDELQKIELSNRNEKVYLQSTVQRFRSLTNFDFD